MYQGENLIFLVSQPRTGSTMLQRILGGHPELHTTSEPFLMLQPFYAMREDGPGGNDFRADLARRALQHFLRGLPNGESDYYEGTRRMYGYLYERALAASGKRYFVDKTPWYSLILPELSRTFPCAHFLILLRNPLAALVSLIDTWEDFWCWIRQWRAALLDFPRLLLEGKDFLSGKGLVLRYEQLVQDPGRALQCVCNWLRIDFLPDMVEYGGGNLPVFPIGDPRRVYQHSRPTAKYVDAWQTRLADPQMWRWTSDYLDHLGPDVLGRMGYPYAELRAVLDARRPSRLRLSCQTVSLEVLLGARPGRFERLTLHAARVRRVVRSRGVGGTAVEAVRRLARAVAGS